MKLYKEEDVKEMLNKINALLPDKESLLKYAVEHITEYMTPIELPSDDKITRLEVINHAKNHQSIGRILTLYKELGDFNSIELSYQDGGRTLKIFLD